VRVIAVLGALLFAYLAVIPAALVGATVDPACSASSSCGYATPVTVYLVIAFAVCSLGLVGAALSLAAFAASPSASTGRLVGRALKLSVAGVGVLLYSEFVLAYPIPALVILAISVAGGWSISRVRPRRAGTRRAPG
jgi:hypothetical protein